MTLAVALGALALLATLLLTRPWWRRPAGDTAPALAQRAANIAAYRSRLAEIARDVESGVLPAADAEPLRSEAAAQLLGDVDSDAAAAPSDGAAASRRSLWAAILIATLVPLGAGLWYGSAGSWQVQQRIAAAGSDAPPPQVLAMVERLRSHLQAEPGDVQGWQLYGRSCFVLKRYAEAAGAYHQMNAHNGGQDADGLSLEGEALAFAAGSEIPPQAAALFDQALGLAPDNGRGLWYGGLADAQAGNYARAGERWRRLQQQADLPAEMKTVLDSQLARLSEAAASPEGRAGSAAAASAAADAVALQVTVRVDPALQARLPAQASVFIYAKADGGPPAPLAVTRQPLGQWPLQVRLDDSMAMLPALRLSAFARYVVGARISVSGQALPAPGDFYGEVHATRAEAGQPLTVVIDQVIR